MQDKEAYIEALTSYRRGDLEPIVTAFAISSLHAVAHGRTMWRRLDQVRHKWAKAVQARSDSAVWRLMEVLVEHPVLDAAIAARELEMSETNVHRHLATLQDAGILIGQKHYKSRRTLWRAPDVLDVVDQYSRDVGRRSR